MWRVSTLQLNFCVLQIFYFCTHPKVPESLSSLFEENTLLIRPYSADQVSSLHFPTPFHFSLWRNAPNSFVLLSWIRIDLEILPCTQGKIQEFSVHLPQASVGEKWEDLWDPHSSGKYQSNFYICCCCLFRQSPYRFCEWFWSFSKESSQEQYFQYNNSWILAGLRNTAFLKFCACRMDFHWCMSHVNKSG